MFDLLVHAEDTVNYQLGGDAVIKVLRVSEIGSGTM